MTTSIDFNTVIDKYLQRTDFDRIEPRAALIDMDGTLYDSMGNHATAWQRMMHEVGVDLDRDEFFLYEGMTGAATITHLFRRELHREPTADEIKELYHRKTVLFSEQPAVSMMPGASEVINTLKREGIRRELVTGSGQSSLIGRLDTDYPGAFAPTDRITSRDVTKGKPHPEPYLKAMEIADVKPWQAIVFENAPLGVESGAAAGAFTIGVTTGPIAASKLYDAGADIVFDSMPQCAEMLPNLLLCITRNN